MMRTKAARRSEVIEIGGEAPTNSGAAAIEMSEPYTARVQITGVADLIFHRFQCDEVDAKAKAAKGSKAKKTDNIEAYVYRDADNYLALPGEYLRQSIITASKFKQDPRSPRKSMMDLTKASVISLTKLASLGVKQWDYEDRRRVRVQMAAVCRTRPALREGWTCEHEFLVNMPEYISPATLHSLLNEAGKLIGVGDFRPTYGRFLVSSFEIV